MKSIRAALLFSLLVLACSASVSANASAFNFSRPQFSDRQDRADVVALKGSVAPNGSINVSKIFQYDFLDCIIKGICMIEMLVTGENAVPSAFTDYGDIASSGWVESTGGIIPFPQLYNILTANKWNKKDFQISSHYVSTPCFIYSIPGAQRQIPFFHAHSK